MNLYFVSYLYCEEFNKDLFVSAHTPQQAIDLWKDYYEVENYVERDMAIFLIPSVGSKPTTHAWHKDVRKVT